MESWARSYSSGVGRAFTDTSAQLVEFYRSFRKLDIVAASARTLSKNMVQLGNDIASSLGVDPSGLMSALLSAINGNTDALAAYGIAIDNAEIKQKLLDAGFNPDSATSAQKALALLSVATNKAAGAWNHLRENVEGYDNQQRMLNAELQETRELLGNLLTRSTSRFTKMLIGAVRVVRQWITANTEMVKKLVNLPVILNAASIAFKALAIGASLLAGALLAVGSAFSMLFSPIGIITAEFIKQLRVLNALKLQYHEAFGGAIEDMVSTVMAAKIAGISIGNWFKIGFAAVKMAAVRAVQAVLEKFTSLVSALPRIISSFGGFDILGDTIGSHISRGILIAEIAILDFAATTSQAVNAASKSFFEIYAIIRKVYTTTNLAVKAWMVWMKTTSGHPLEALGLAQDLYNDTSLKDMEKELAQLRQSFEKPLNTDSIKAAADKVRSELQSLNSNRDRRQTASAALDALDGVQGLVGSYGKLFSAAFGQSARELRTGLEDALRADRANPLVEKIASISEVATGAVAQTLSAASAGLNKEAVKLQQQITALKDPANNDTGGMEAVDQIKALYAKFMEAAKNNPAVKDLKNLSEELLSSMGSISQTKVSAQGSFSGQLQGESVNIAKQALGYQRETARETRETRKQLSSGAIVYVAG